MGSSYSLFPTFPAENYGFDFSPNALNDTLHNLHESTSDYDEPLIQFVDGILQDAISQLASDIHIEPYQTHCRIRYRLDGLLYKVAEIPHPLAERLIARLKVLAKLDITERRLPQDGRIQIQHAKPIDIRINTCPTVFGEKIVLRLLNISRTQLDIPTLGMTREQTSLFLKTLTTPHGLILVTGPTGSGKTVTLYSALDHLNTIEKNISTAEDPVEIQLNGINQVSINPKIGLDFPTLLKTFLRQDPDIIMIGEIRDPETAKIAIQAAQTGHLVLSTLHTNNAKETLARLRSLGIKEYDINNTVKLVIAQRLLRKLCTYCKKSLYHDGITSYQAQGCQHCLHGYKGRIGIYEFYTPTHHNDSLLENARQKAKEGLTSLSEINRLLA